eukprot:gene16262-17363_t
MDLLTVVAVVSCNCHGSVWSRQPCAANVANNTADIVTRWGRGIDPSKEGQDLARSILVPFPPESCLSGLRENHQYQYYRRIFNATTSVDKATILHFGAVDWQCAVWLNGALLGEHSGGYDGFSFDITRHLHKNGAANELIVFAYDPSELGPQPFGKQRAYSIANPGTMGEKYTPTSGIWQTVWLEVVPRAAYIENIGVEANLTTIVVTINAILSDEQQQQQQQQHREQPQRKHSGVTFSPSVGVVVEVESAPGTIVATRTAAIMQTYPHTYTARVALPIASPKLWSPTNPFLYNLTVKLVNPPAPTTARAASISALASASASASASIIDSVASYAGMRTVSLGDGGLGRKSLYLNGKRFIATGWLDQSWWPDGQYTAPSDEALAFDVAALKTYGMNMVRLHQKINPERWYYHADRLGVVVFQDAVQHFNYGSSPDFPAYPNEKINTTIFSSEWAKAITGRKNHPSIVQWDIFNEFEFTIKDWQPPSAILNLTRSLDPSRLVDFNSGGPGNNLGLGDVNDIHDYPDPRQEGLASPSQYGELGEFGGIGWAPTGHEWLPGQCQHRSAGNVGTNSTVGACIYLRELARARESFMVGNISAIVYTQITDVELECDGFLAYDRTPHFNDADAAKIKAANEALTEQRWRDAVTDTC